MAKKRAPEADKHWHHLDPEDGHVFDQTNGLVPRAEAEPPASHSTGMTDEERSAAGAIISGGFSGA